MRVRSARLKKLKSIFIWSFLIFHLTPVYSQDYTFKNYLDDTKIRNHLETFNSIDHIDSVEFYLNKYKDKLRYNKYLFTSILLNNKGNALSNNYLDTAFMLGLSSPCIHKYLFRNYNQNYAEQSFKKNYLKAFDSKLIAVLDSLRTEDQRYRQAINTIKNKSITDSLLILQNKIDSSNFAFYKNLITTKGWPGFKKVGTVACAYAPPSPNIVIIHLGTKEREYQITLIKHLIELCKKQEEDWGNIIWLLTNLYFRHSDTYSEFSILKVSNNKLVIDASLFSLYCMTELLVKMPSKKIVIQCNNAQIFESIKSGMLEMNNWVIIPYVDEETAKEFKIAIPKKLDQNAFLFEPNKSISDNKVFFKFINK